MPFNGCLIGRNQRLQAVLETVVGNGLKAGWVSLGHDDDAGQILPLLQASKDLREAEMRREGVEQQIPIGMNVESVGEVDA